MWNNNQGFPNSNQGFNQGFPNSNQGFNQGFPQQQNFPNQGFPNQGFPQPTINFTVTHQQPQNTFEKPNSYIHHHLHKVIGDTLHTHQSLRAGECLKSKTYSYFLTMQNDGNLVLYSNDHFVSSNAIWSSGTHGKGHGPHHLRMQEDGNLVVYDSHNKPTWSSETYKKGAHGHNLIMQDDGNLVVYDGHKKPTWASNTQRK